MTPITDADPQSRSADLVADHVARIAAQFPEAVAEGKVDFDVLRQLLGGAVDERDEKYGLFWHGKRRARQLALIPSTGTLRPVPADSVEWDTTRNLMIEGDNLEVLKLLQKSYSGKVKLIYIDPPYNRGDRIYPDDFRDSLGNYLRLTGQADQNGHGVTSNTEASGRFHTNWLNMMYPRLKLARDLLAEDGVLVISIDETEYMNLRAICTEIYGEENQIGTLVWKNATDNNPTNISTEHEYLLFVAKGKDAIESEWRTYASDIKDVLAKVGSDLIKKHSGSALQEAYDQWFREHKSELGPLDRYKYIDEGGVYTGSQSVHNPGREGYRYDVIHPTTKQPCKQPLMGYRFPKDTMEKLLSEEKVLFGEDETKIIELKVYASEFQDKLASVFDLDGRLGAYDLKEDFPQDGRIFSNPKPVRLLMSFFSYLLKSGDLALDFFAGSGTTGRAIWQLTAKDGVQRRFVLVQLPEPLDPSNSDQKAAAAFCDSIGKPRTIAELTKERLRRAGKRIKAETPLFGGDTGFRVYKLDKSNIRPWNPQPADLGKSLFDSVDHLDTGRTEDDVLTELLLKLGLDLCVPIETKTIAGKTVHSVGGGVLIVCLAPSVTAKQVEPLALGIVEWHKALAPAGDSQAVFRDAAFADDVAKTNLTAILAQHGLTNVRSL